MEKTKQESWVAGLLKGRKKEENPPAKLRRGSLKSQRRGVNLNLKKGRLSRNLGTVDRYLP